MPCLSFCPVTPGAVSGLIQRARPATCALDPIPTSVIRKFADIIAAPIAAIINASLNAGHFADQLKQAIVTPLLKKPSLPKDNFSSYRPISNMAFLSKVCESCEADQLATHLESHGLLPMVQSAYRPLHYTETALFGVQDDLLLEIDRGGAVTLALLDLSAAFDTVSHSQLLHRLSSHCGVSGPLLDWFRSYLSSRAQTVRVKTTASKVFPLKCGVPQGSVLGPLLFIIYTAPLQRIAARHRIRIHLYADDTQLYVGFKIDDDGSSQLEATARMTACIMEIREKKSTTEIKRFSASRNIRRNLLFPARPKAGLPYRKRKKRRR